MNYKEIEKLAQSHDLGVFLDIVEGNKTELYELKLVNLQDDTNILTSSSPLLADVLEIMASKIRRLE